MASSDVMHLIEQDFLSSKDENGNSRGLSIEKKIEYLESLTGKVSNRRSRRWINDRLLMELVPRLKADEIRGLFAPPPWGDAVPISPFCMTNVGEWDRFRNIDMDKQANIIDVPSNQSAKRQAQGVSDKMVTLNAWRRIDSRTRDVLCRTFLTEVLEVYEDCVRAFIQQNGDDTLTLAVQDPFHRLLLHGVCEFYNLVSVTVTVSASEGTESSKMTRVTKKSDAAELPNLTLCYFLEMSKKGIW